MSRSTCDGECRAIMSELELVPGTDYRTKLEISEGGSAIDHVDKSRARQRIPVIGGAPSLQDRGAGRI